MLRITIKGDEYFNEETQEFSNKGDVVVDLEHSLVSLSKWESKYQVPFLSSLDKTSEQMLDYLRFMVVSKRVDPNVMYFISEENMQEIQAYIDSKESATTFGEMPERKGPAETITAELVYYWMVAFNIPFECQHWHLNRLFALIRICNIKNSPPKKMSKHEISRKYHELNEKRKAELGTNG